jgi:hypothetical protein
MIPWNVTNENALQWHTVFLGRVMQHNYWLYYVIDDILRSNKVKSIVEIGTGSGALTSVFGLWGIIQELRVLSIDNQDVGTYKNVLKYIKVKLLIADEFLESTKDKILEFVNNEPTYLYCDGGDKKIEFNTFVPLLPRGSIVSVHDWGNECKLENIIEVAGKYCKPYKEERWLEMNVQLATFRIE